MKYERRDEIELDQNDIKEAIGEWLKEEHDINIDVGTCDFTFVLKKEVLTAEIIYLNENK